MRRLLAADCRDAAQAEFDYPFAHADEMANPVARALTDWLRSAVRPFRETIALRRSTGGQSKATYTLATPDETFVLRE